MRHQEPRLNIIDTAQKTENAKNIIGTVLPDKELREIVLKQLLLSANAAEKLAPGAWSVTLFSDGFCLNVGAVEAFVFSSNFIRINLVGAVGNAPFEGPFFGHSDYRSIPQPTCAFRGSPLDFANLRVSLHESHLRFIHCAAITKSGKPRRGTPFSRFHDDGLIAYAREVTSPSSLATLREEPWLLNEEEPASDQFNEGAQLKVLVNAYERSINARKKCLAYYGETCVVCGFNFGTEYGAAAQGYIQVHHLTPLSSIGKQYSVHPVDDLRPVCANCHAVIHIRRENPYSIEEVRAMIHSRSLSTQDL